MSDESMDKRTNGSGGSGSGRGGSAGAGRTPARSGPRDTANLAAKFRDAFGDLVEASYRTRWLEGTAGVAPRRALADFLESTHGMMPDLITRLRAEASDIERGSKSVIDDLPAEPPKKP